MALLNAIFLDTLVAIGATQRTKNGRKKFVCHATGFLIGFIAKDSKDPEKKLYSIFLVTNKHVFSDKTSVSLRFNTKDGKTKIFHQGLRFPQNNELRWLAHRNKNVDLALLNVSPNILKQNSIKYAFLNEEIFAYSRNFKKIGIESGDSLYVLGFPMGISGEIQNYPCVKWGIISRADKEIIKNSKAFLIDSSIFPGNSGGPVIYRPTSLTLENATAVEKPFLLGVVCSYLTYEEQLFTHQTSPPTVVSLSRENSGLSFVVPMDFVRQIFKNWKKQKKKLEKAQKQKEKISPREEIK